MDKKYNMQPCAQAILNTAKENGWEYVSSLCVECVIDRLKDMYEDGNGLLLTPPSAPGEKEVVWFDGALAKFADLERLHVEFVQRRREATEPFEQLFLDKAAIAKVVSGMGYNKTDKVLSISAVLDIFTATVKEASRRVDDSIMARFEYGLALVRIEEQLAALVGPSYIPNGLVEHFTACFSAVYVTEDPEYAIEVARLRAKLIAERAVVERPSETVDAEAEDWGDNSPCGDSWTR